MARTFVMQSAEVICQKLETLGLSKEEDKKLFKEIAKSAGMEKGVKPFVAMFLKGFVTVNKDPINVLSYVYIMDDFANALIDDEEFRDLVKENAKSLSRVLYMEIFGG